MESFASVLVLITCLGCIIYVMSIFHVTMSIKRIEDFRGEDCSITMEYTRGFSGKNVYTKQYVGNKEEWYLFPSGTKAGKGMSATLCGFWRVWSWHKEGLIKGDPNKVWQRQG